MDMIRKGESGVIPFRSGRFFNVETKWYFTSREGIDYGPFDSKHEAEINLDIFIQQICQPERQINA